MPVRRTPKVEALVVNAIRRLQDVQGSTSREISNYISQEYNLPRKDIRPQVRLALQRGLSYGILQRARGGQYSCNRDYVRQLTTVGNDAGDGVMEPCPQPSPQRRAHWRRYWRKIRERRRRQREYRAKKKRREEREKRKRSRRGRRRPRRRRRGRSRRRRRTRSRRGRRRGRRRSRRRSRRRTRRGRRPSRAREGRSRSRRVADPNEIETEAMAPQPIENIPTNDNSRKSATSVSERSTEQHLPESPRVSNASDDA